MAGKYFGFIYEWYNRVEKMFYLGSHFGSERDRYSGSGSAFKKAYKAHPEDFKRRILQYCNIDDHDFLLLLEGGFLKYIKHEEIGVKYFNKSLRALGMDPETSRKLGNKRVADGTHNFLGGEIQNKRVAEGTHPFLGGEEVRKRVADGTHHFLGGEMQRRNTLERVAEGTYHLLGPKVNNKRVAEGTHPFLGGEEVRKRVADGTHHFLGPEMSNKRIADGTHNLLGKNQAKLECPHCGFVCNEGLAKRWHFDNCKHLILEAAE